MKSTSASAAWSPRSTTVAVTFTNPDAFVVGSDTKVYGASPSLPAAPVELAKSTLRTPH